MEAESISKPYYTSNEDNLFSCPRCLSMVVVLLLRRGGDAFNLGYYEVATTDKDSVVGKGQ